MRLHDKFPRFIRPKHNSWEVNRLKREDGKDLCFGVDDTCVGGVRRRSKNGRGSIYLRLPPTACRRSDSCCCPLSHWHHHPVQWPLQVQVQPGQESEDRKQCSADACRPRSFLRMLDVDCAHRLPIPATIR
ncbi:hypothetical protein PBY51_018039 [Eleginops maclovinus]|uniref:Uncharacterized protein n=1 Tax=Eleginops maclovinus TaxID=56733 RepID=A0AAN7XLN8_ELEMC|nr:hypothetical protein PBY51_018039 [Eleginops maclovinus]